MADGVPVADIEASLALSTPFLLHELRHGFSSVPALLGVAGGPARFDPSAFAFAAELVGPGAYPTVASGALDDFRAAALPWAGLDVAMAAALALGVVAVGRDLVGGEGELAGGDRNGDATVWQARKWQKPPVQSRMRQATTRRATPARN